MALVLTRLVRSNYDELDNIPVIHQDLTASFTKQADTYYIHTGSTTSAYTKGRMYYCDGTNLKKVVIVDEVNDGKLTITVNGTAHTFTANQSGNTSFSITDTGATSVEVTGDGNAVTTASYNASTRKLTLTKGTTFLIKHQSIKSINTNNTAAQTVNASEAITGSGTINLHKVSKTGNYNDLLNKPAIPDISGKLDKTTYEWNKEFAAGSNGAISLGRYNIYDTQLTFDISSTTSASMNGKLVIATQNGRICQAKVFGDASGVLVSKIVIYQSAIVNNRSWIEIFCNFDGWSKNKVHIYGVALESATVTNQMSSVTFTNGVPSPITSGDSKWNGTIDNDLSIKTLNTNNTTAQTATNENIIGGGTINLHKVAKTGSYNDLLNAPTFSYNSSTKALTIS